jgi:hypothetical protein
VPSSWNLELEHQGLQSKELNQLAKRCLFGSLAGLIVSFANICVLASRDGGREEGTVCMRWCVVDVVVNDVAIYAVMGGRKEGDWWWAKDGKGVRPDVSLPLGFGELRTMVLVLECRRRQRGEGRQWVLLLLLRRKRVRWLRRSRRRDVLGSLTSTPDKAHPHLPRTNDLFSSLSPPPTKVSPLDSPLDRQMARKAKCVSLQPDPRSPSSIKMRFSSSFDSLARQQGGARRRRNGVVVR